MILCGPQDLCNGEIAGEPPRDKHRCKCQGSPERNKTYIIKGQKRAPQRNNALSSARIGLDFRHAPPWCLRSAIYWIFIFVLLHQILPSQSQQNGFLFIKFIEYKNPERLLADGFCCDERRKPCVSQTLSCDHIFVICATDPSVKDKPCSIGTELLRGPLQSNDIRFTGAIEKLGFPKWPGTVEIKITVKEMDNFDTVNAELVDHFSYTFTKPALTQDRTESTTEITLTGNRTLHKTTLKISVWTYCDFDTYQGDCSVRCYNQDSCANGHYTCDPTTGGKACLAGWSGTDCKTKVSGGADCKGNYTGLPESVWSSTFTCQTKQMTLTLNVTSIAAEKFTGTILVTSGSDSGTYKITGDQTKLNKIIITDGDWVTQNPKVPKFQFDVALSQNSLSLTGSASAISACAVQGVTFSRSSVRELSCQYGGACWKRASYYNQFTCCCKPEFSGTRCEIAPNRCSGSPCKNSATCSNNADASDFVCNCTKGYYSKDCSKTPLQIPCDPNPCQQKGVCFWNATTGSKCRCPDYYGGTYCETRTNVTQTPCPTYYFGPDCTIYCKPSNSCDGHYLCNANTGKKICLPEWQGVNCTEHKNLDAAAIQKHCPDNKACDNRGSCFAGKCCCLPGYNGTHCSTQINMCDSQPCQNKATCNAKFNAYDCSCLPGYTGKNCETIINYCATNPCKNGGVCELLEPGKGYQCRCKGRFYGTNCQTAGKDIQCTTTLCKNSGQCDYNATYGFSCTCQKGSAGDMCEATPPGPPAEFTKVTSSTVALTLKWKNPATTSGLIQAFLVICVPYITFNTTVAKDPQKYSKNATLTWKDYTYSMGNLEPGTKYNCSLQASTKAGYGQHINKTIATKPGKPVLNARPTVEAVTDSTIALQLPAITIGTGPISAYQLVVQLISSNRLKKRSISQYALIDDGRHAWSTFSSDVLHRQKRSTNPELGKDLANNLKNYSSAKNASLKHYVAAEFKPRQTFVLGDGKTYGKFYNAPLQTGQKYNVYFGVISTLNGDTASTYVILGVPIRVERPLDDTTWRIGLGVGLGLIFLAFVLILILIFVYRDKKKEDADSGFSESPQGSRRRIARFTAANKTDAVMVSQDNVTGATNRSFDLDHHHVHSPVAHASDAYTLQQRLSFDDLPERYEIDYNDYMSVYGKFDNKGFVTTTHNRY